ncbi:glycerol transporter [Mycoblastus sanguinarius]|nr:glycerol transporter [Mycoblastus sanguinarius]
MSLLQYAERLYSLDTLDTRFINSSKTLPPQIDPARSSRDRADYSTGRKERDGAEEQSRGASPPRWRTPEFAYHGLIFLVIVPFMFKTAYDVSKPSHPEYTKFAPLLSPGWIPGRMVDNSDTQYASFRDNVPYLFIVMILHPLLRRLFNTVYEPSGIPTNSTPNSSSSPLASENARADSRLKQRVSFDVGFGILFLLALHGLSAPKVLLILYINYSIATRFKREYVPAATWIFNIGILFANELGKGYPYTNMADTILHWLAGPEAFAEQTSKENWGAVLDNYGGLIPRWEILFKVTILRLISFNLDYYWSLSRRGGSTVEKKQLDPANLSERDRVDLPAKSQDFSFPNYLAYALYSPLYLAGPILTFNDYTSQQRHTPQSITPDRNLLYGVRFLLAFLAMEVIIHFIYAIAIFKAQPAWEVYTPFQLSMLGYFNLHHIWLKLLLLWRFFRLWALLDGIDPPENVVRCMSDNYSAFAFWRGWHRSFNRWITRYIYIPLGGSGGPGTRGKWGQVRGIVNLMIVFTFVAMWHDIQLRLLVWGWLISLFVLPELVAGYLFPKQKWQNHREVYRIICGIGGVGNILMMMLANLVGFAVGLDGLKGLVQGIVGSYSGLVFLAFACATLFTGVQVMFELRQQELRQGIIMRC